MKQIATVVNNNQPDGQNIVETAPNVTLPIGTKLYSPEPYALLGSPLGGGFFAGEITIAGVLYALIVAPKAEGEKLELAYKNRNTADGVDNDEDGAANRAAIADDNHPAALFCRQLQIGGYDDWYLPSRDELAMAQRNLGARRKNTPEVFREGATEAFETQWYWSSTERASSPLSAWVVGFDDGSQSDYPKYYGLGVRAVRRLAI